MVGTTLAYCCCDKHQDQKKLGEESVYVAYRLEFITKAEEVDTGRSPELTSQRASPPWRVPDQ